MLHEDRGAMAQVLVRIHRTTGVSGFTRNLHRYLNPGRTGPVYYDGLQTLRHARTQWTS